MHVHGVHYRLQIICHTLCLWFGCVLSAKGSPQLESEIVECIYFINFLFIRFNGSFVFVRSSLEFQPLRCRSFSSGEALLL